MNKYTHLLIGSLSLNMNMNTIKPDTIMTKSVSKVLAIY